MDDGTRRLTAQFENAISVWEEYMAYLTGKSSTSDTRGDNFSAHQNNCNKHEDRRITYRASCLRSGKHEFNSQNIAVHVGGQIHDIKSPQWSVSLKNYDVEIYILIMQTAFVIGVPLLCCGSRAQLTNLKGSSNLPRESRPLLPYKRADSMLRPSTAHLMILLAKVKPGDFVLDPMCGGGTIPIESSVMYGSYNSDVFSMGGDIDEECMSVSSKNIKMASSLAIDLGSVNLKNGVRFLADAPPATATSADGNSRASRKQQMLPCDLVKWSVLNIPLRSCVADAVVCDLPFDMKCKMKKQNFPHIFREMFRILRVGGRAVLLVRWRNLFIKIVEKTNSCVLIERKFDVCIGGTIVTLFVVVKTKLMQPLEEK